MEQGRDDNAPETRLDRVKPVCVHRAPKPKLDLTAAIVNGDRYR
jgi:hypothetical protein